MNPPTTSAPVHEDGLEDSDLYNADLAPVPTVRRTWSVWNFAALWISMSACIPTYMLASSLIGGGMNWSQAVLTIFLGNLIVLLPMVLNAHAGTKYGIPFPVFCRAAFGTRGANVPAMLRALVACGWFGIQTWIGGNAIYKILGVFFPALDGTSPLPMLGITFGQLACFLFFWSINVWIIYRGIDSIRWLLSFKAPLLILLGLLLLGWAYHAAGGFGPMLSQPSQFDPGQPKAGGFWKYFGPALTGMISFWATLSLNIPDFSRYARTQRDQVAGQALGLPLTMAFYSFIGVAVTSATTIIYGKTLWDPVDVLTRFKNPAVLVVALLALCVATLATNIAANVVGPANDFAALSPRRISFRTGGFITGIIGILAFHHAMETRCRSERLHLHLAGGILGAAWPDRGYPNRGLLRGPPLPTRYHRTLRAERKIRLHERLVARGHQRTRAGDLAEPAGLPRHGEMAPGHERARVPRGSVRLRVVPRFYGGLRGVSGVPQTGGTEGRVKFFSVFGKTGVFTLTVVVRSPKTPPITGWIVVSETLGIKV